MTAQLATFEDSALIKLALAGNNGGFAALMDRHSGAVRRRIGFMARNMTDAEDILQEVSLKVWRNLSTYRSESSFRSWMTRVAINEVLQFHRRRRRSPLCQAFGDLDAFASPADSPDKSLTRAEATRAVRGALARLPEKYREVLILRDLEQFSARETAASLRATVPAIKTRLFRARLLLSAALARPRLLQ
jgi:RNA polymerase sigma factor (sigma-70 family)